MSESDTLLPHVRDMIERADRSGGIYFTRFLSESEAAHIREAGAVQSGAVQSGAVQSGAVRSGTAGGGYGSGTGGRQAGSGRLFIPQSLVLQFWGGFDEALRTVLAVGSDYCFPGYSGNVEGCGSEKSRNEFFSSLFPIVCVTADFTPSAVLSHRDILGALMSLGLSRDAVGDIIVSKGRAQFFVLESCVQLIETDLGRCGRHELKIRTDLPFSMDTSGRFRLIEGTAASLRLDAFIRTAAFLSRDKAAALIRQGDVRLNGRVCDSVSQRAGEGDIFSVRGFGKFRIAACSDLTKKGRYRIKLEKYV